MDIRKIVRNPELRIALLFLTFYLVVHVGPLVILGYLPLRPLDYLVGIGFAFRLVLGPRSLMPSCLVLAVVYSATAGVQVGCSLAVVYTVGYAAGIWLARSRAGAEPWFTTPRSALAVLAGATLTCVISSMGSELWISRIEGEGDAAIRLYGISGVARELSGILALAPIVLVRFGRSLRAFAQLPPDPRDAGLPRAVAWGEVLLLSILSVAVFALAVLYRRDYQVDLVLFGFAPLAIVAARCGIASTAVALALATLAGSTLWSTLHWSKILTLGDLRVLLMTPAVTTLLIASFVEQRREARRQVELRIVKLRTLAASTEEAREAERTRLAREVHDELGQLLTGLKITLKMLSTGPRPASVSELHAVRAEVDAVLSQTEQIGDQLSPELMRVREPLPEALSRLARDYEQKFGLRCVVWSECPDPPSGSRAEAVRRIAVEALTNVARHAEATFVSIRLERTGDYVLLEITDDGKGIGRRNSTTTTSSLPGLGVVGMKERASLLGGSLTVKAGESKGTRVLLQIPEPVMDVGALLQKTPEI